MLTRMSMMLFGYLIFFLLARVLDKNDFGTWVVFLSIVKMSESIRNAFIYNPLLRYLNSEDVTNHKEVINASFFLNLAISLFFSVVFILIGEIINFYSPDSALRPMLYISIVACLAFSFFAHFNFLQQADLRFMGTLISSVSQNFVLFLYLGFVLLMGEIITLTNAAWAMVFGYLVSVVISYLFSLYKNVQISLRIDPSWLKRLFHYGKYTFGTNMGSMLNKSSKEWFLSALVNNTAVAIFAPALRIVNFFEIPLNAINAVYYPKVISKVKEEGGNQARYMYEKSVGILILGLFPIGLAVFVFAEQIVLILMGGDYLESVGILKVILIVGVIAPFQRQFGVTLNAIGKAKVNFYFMLLTSSIGMTMSVLLILVFGVMGAAYGAAITSVLSTIACQIILSRMIGVSTIRIFHYSLVALKEGVSKISR